MGFFFVGFFWGGLFTLLLLSSYFTIIICIMYSGKKCSSVAEHLFEVQWVVGSINLGGPTELFFISTII